MRKSARRNLPFIGALLALSFMAGCSKTESEPEPVVSVQAATATEQPIEKVIRAEAILFPIDQSAITPKISAPVKRFYVNRGSHVKAGQLLATLENRDLEAAKVENQGALSQAEATYESTTAASLPEEMQKAELDEEAAKQALDAEQKLFDSRENLYRQGALPRKDLDQARVSLVQARTQYEIAKKHFAALQAVGKQQEMKSASGQLESARGKYLGSQAQLSYSEIRSPINGVVTERPLYPGEMAAAGSPLLVVMNTSRVIAKAHIPQQDAALLKAGDPAELTAPGIDGNIPARITVVSPATDPNSTTIEIWAEASNSGNRLKPGTTVELSAVAEKIDKALVVPASAILNPPEGGTSVMVVGADNRAHRREVQLGVVSGDKVQITSGLKAGERVITSGAYGLPDNTQVTVATAGGDSGD